MSTRDDLNAGTTLRAEQTGRTYTVTAIDSEERVVHVEGLTPIPLGALEQDIAAGKIEVLSE